MKRIITGLFVLCTGYLLNAQSITFPFKSTEVILVERAVRDGVVLLSQEYQLEDTLSHKRYSLDNQDFFGKEDAFAVLAGQGIITSRCLVMPWENDSNYRRYKDAYYRPVVSRTLIKTTADSTWRETPIFQPVTTRTLGDSLLVFAHDTVYCNGFACDSLINGSDGWMVWLVENKNVLSLVTNRYKYEQCEDEVAFVETPQVDGRIFGGVFIIACYERIGSIDLKLCGMLTFSDNKWRISSVLLKVDKDDVIAEDVHTPTLTPIGNDEPYPEELEKNNTPVKKDKKEGQK